MRELVLLFLFSFFIALAVVYTGFMTTNNIKIVLKEFLFSPCYVSLEIFTLKGSTNTISKYKQKLIETSTDHVHGYHH